MIDRGDGIIIRASGRSEQPLMMFIVTIESGIGLHLHAVLVVLALGVDGVSYWS